MGKKAKRQIARLTRELAHAKARIGHNEQFIFETGREFGARFKQYAEEVEGLKLHIDAQARELDLMKLGDPNAGATPILFNDFISLVCELPVDRHRGGDMYYLPVPPIDQGLTYRPEHRPLSPDRAKLGCRSISYRVPVGSSSQHMQGWMLPARIVLIDDGTRRNVVVKPHDLDALRRDAQSFRSWRPS